MLLLNQKPIKLKRKINFADLEIITIVFDVFQHVLNQVLKHIKEVVFNKRRFTDKKVKPIIDSVM